MVLSEIDNQGSLLGGGTTAIGGYVGVKQLQEQLRRIAFEFGKPQVDPAQYDGTLTLGTIIALANAGPIVGDKIHSGVGQALDVIKLIKAPISKLPYGSTIINFILSPWTVDKVFSAILGIIRLIPGGGGVATGIDNAMKAVKTTLSTAAGPIAAALLVVKKSNGFGAWLGDFEPEPPTWYRPLGDFEPEPPTWYRPLGDFEPEPPVWVDGFGETAPATRAGYCWIPGYTRTTDNVFVPGHWERERATEPRCPVSQEGAPTATPVVRDQRAGSTTCTATTPQNCPGGVFVASTSTGQQVPTRVALPPPPGSFTSGVIRDHRSWTPGRRIYSTDWSKTKTYSGKAPKASLHQIDRDTWEKVKNTGPGAIINKPELTPRYGAIAFLVFRSTIDNARMGAFWDERTETLTIKPVPEPSSSKYPWDYAADAVKAVAGGVADAASAVGSLVADIAQSTWNWIAENADDVYRAVKKYGCALVNNDIVVGIAAGAAGIVATPATSAAIVTGAQVGKAACAAMEVAEVLYAIYQLMTMKVPAPPPLTTPTPPTPQQVQTFQVADVKLLLPLTKPVVPLAKPRYPAGSIAAFDPKTKRYIVAIPVGTELNTALAGASFGATASHFIVETTEAAPPIVAVVPLTILQRQTDTLPYYKNPIFWVAVGTTAAAVGGGGYVLYRRRRRLTR